MRRIQTVPSTGCRGSSNKSHPVFRSLLRAKIHRVRVTEAAGRVVVVDNRLTWEELRSYSTRQRRGTPTSGLLGTVLLEACDADGWSRFWPWLVWGQFVHVGKDAVKGEKVRARVIFGKRGERVVGFYITQWRPMDGDYDMSAFDVFDRFVKSFKFLKKSFYETL